MAANNTTLNHSAVPPAALLERDERSDGATSLPSRILRLHRSEKSRPEIHSWSESDLVDEVARLMARSSSAESVAVLQVVPTGLRSMRSVSDVRRAQRRIDGLAQHCRSLVRNYDMVGVRDDFSISVIMWGVSPDPKIPERLAMRLLGPGLDGQPVGLSCVIGAAIGRPDGTAESLVRTSIQAVAQAKWTSRTVVVRGGRPHPEAAFDANASVEASLRRVIDSQRPAAIDMAARLLLCSRRRRRSDFFANPGCNLVDHLVVAIEAISSLFESPPLQWDRLLVDLPLVSLRSSNTTPRVVEAVTAELRTPEKLVVRLVGPGGPEMLDVVDELLAPLRASGATVERVWDYRAGGNDDAATVRPTIVRVPAAITATYLDRSDPKTVMAEGPVALARSLGVDLLLEGVSDKRLVRLATSFGVRYTAGKSVGAPHHHPLRGLELHGAA